MEQFTLEELRKIIYIREDGRKVLNLSKRNLSNLPSALSELTELEVLDLGYNELKEVSGINKLKNLKKLYLYENKLNEFPESVCELEKLEELHVSSNNLKVLPESFCKLKRLRGLYLSDNKLSSLPNDFAELEELVELFVHNNELRVLPDSVCKMKELRELDLSNNNLSSLPDGFAELKLTELDVYGNPFTAEEKRKVEEILNRIKHRRDKAVFAALPEEEEEEEEAAASEVILTTKASPHLSLTKVFAALPEEEEEEEAVPQYILARGVQATAAYQRALKFGKTKDKRVKIHVIGRDRAGKTSLVRSLKGERFREDEVSTDGVEMSQPLKNADKQPWKNAALPEDTTVYHHRFAEYINRDLASQEGSVEGLAADYAGITEGIASSFKEEKLEEREIPHKIARLEEAVQEEEEGKEEEEEKEELREIPQEIANLVEVLEQDSSRTSNGIWPVIWDFAGQSIFRAIHPIFMSLAAVYILVFDLTQELTATAQCHVREEGYDDVEIPAPDSDDTNLDHNMRWLDLLHSFSEDDETLPAVILVGTHADSVNGDPEQRMDAVINTIIDSADIFNNHIESTFTIDNTTAGQFGEEDPIINLREEILKVAEKLPHTKDDIPLIWLEVEDGVYSQVTQGEKYMTRQKFKTKIATKICDFESEDDFEVLLQFLHDRGTIVYHDRADNPDGLVVLDPQWLVDVICKIITTDKQKGEKPRIRLLRRELANHGILRAELLELSCKAQQLTDIQHSLLFIMKKFNLLCEWKHKGESSDFLVPCMLTKKPEGNLFDKILKQHEPVFITFSTNYVPCGLFSRLLVFFWEWAASRTCNCEEQQLFANAATFVIGENTCAAFVCCKTVIKIYILVIDKSKPVDKDVCLELHSVLKNRLDELKKECHWLRAVTWELCGQCPCKQCPKKVNTKTGKCFRHQEKECSDDDCAHYVPVTRKPFVCNCGRRGSVFPVSNTWVQGLLPSTVIDSSQDEPAQGKPVKSDTTLRVTLLASEWSSSMGGLSTINRQLATLLAKHKQVEVTLLVPQFVCSEEEKRDATSHNVAIREAERHPGYDPLDWLSFPPKDLAIDIVLGHGGKLGKQAQIIRKSHNCKWVQVVHTAPEELGMHKNYPKAISKGEEKNRTEIDLCKLANLVVAVGPKLAEAYSSYLRSCKQDQDIIQLTPGTFDEFSDVKQATRESDKFKVLTFGRGDPEDFNLKGYDIAAKAIVELKDRCYRLIFVGAPEGKQDEVADNLLESGISKDQLTVRKFVTSKERLKELFCEADIAIMPSRTEGFGLTALEALSAGLPILVSGNSGFGDALCSLPLGKPLVVDSADPKEWAKAIRAVHLKDRAKRLEEIQRLRTCYEEKYSWEKQCEDLVARMWSLVHDQYRVNKDSATDHEQMTSKAVLSSSLPSQMFQTLRQMQQHNACRVNSETDLSVELKKIASDKGLVISDNQGSGNCLFHALSEQLELVKGIRISHKELRRVIMKYIRENPQTLDGTDLFNFVTGYRSWADYLLNMEREGTWGDHVIIYAAANCYETCIHVISSLPHHQDLIIKPDHPTDNSNPLVLGHIHELHYVSLQPKQVVTHQSEGRNDQYCNEDAPQAFRLCVLY